MTDSSPVRAQPDLRQQVSGQMPDCLDEVCVTCSDSAVPVRIVALLDDSLAIVGTQAGEEEISVALVDAAIGDTVLVHAGEAIAVVPK